MKHALFSTSSPRRSGLYFCFLLLCVISVVPALAVKPVPMNEKAFTQYFAAKLKKSGRFRKIQITKTLEISINDKKGLKQIIFLSNAYSQYRANPGNLAQIIQDQLNARSVSIPPVSKKAVNNILGVIKSADYIKAVKAQMKRVGYKGKGLPMVHEPLAGNLYVFYVIDSKTGMRYLSGSQLKKMGVRRSSLRQIAIRNLMRYFDRKKLNIKAMKAKVLKSSTLYSVVLDRNYEASIMLMPRYWTSRKFFRVKGDPVIFVPARNIVLVTGTGEKEGVQAGSFIARRGYRELGYRITPNAYVYRNGSWSPYR